MTELHPDHLAERAKKTTKFSDTPETDGLNTRVSQSHDSKIVEPVSSGKPQDAGGESLDADSLPRQLEVLARALPILRRLRGKCANEGDAASKRIYEDT
jgi:hypothetical protein